MCGLRSWRGSLLPSRLDFQMITFTFSIFIFLYFSSFNFFIEMWGNVYVDSSDCTSTQLWWMKIFGFTTSNNTSSDHSVNQICKTGWKITFLPAMPGFDGQHQNVRQITLLSAVVKSKTGISRSIENYSFLINNLSSMKYI